MLIGEWMWSITFKIEIMSEYLFKREFIEFNRIIFRMLAMSVEITAGPTEIFLLFHDDKIIFKVSLNKF